MAAWWETVLSVGAGGGFVILGQWLQGHLTTRREREARSQARRVDLEDRQRQYELERLDELRVWLTEAADGLQDAARAYRRETKPLLDQMQSQLQRQTQSGPPPINFARAKEFDVAVRNARAAAVVCFDNRVRSTALEAIQRLGKRRAPDEAYGPVYAALEEIGRRVRELHPGPTSEEKSE